VGVYLFIILQFGLRQAYWDFKVYMKRIDIKNYVKEMDKNSK